MPLISAVMPVYNAEVFLKESIDSVLCQTFSDFELLVLDDGSTDHSADIVRSIPDSRIRFISCRHDFIETVNRGYGEARGKYIAQVDADDILSPERLQVQYRFMEENPHIAACGGWMKCFGKRTNSIQIPLEHEQIVLNMLFHGPLLNPTAFVRRQFLIDHQIIFQRGYSFYADFKFWSEIAKRGKLANLPLILTFYRTTDIQSSVQYATECEAAASKIKQEMLDYLLSIMDKNDSYSKDILKLAPVLQKLKDQNSLSEPVFFRLFYELTRGLLNRGLIKL